MSKSDTLPARVDNLTFLIERVAEDCAPLQEYRELTQNAIEAILRTKERKGQIVWDVNWSLLDASGFYKLCVTDNGDGMDPDHIRQYINNLSSSSGEQSIEGNFGIGGKITAGFHNPAGVQYLSWRDGAAAMAHYWYDPLVQKYGLKQFDLGAGLFSHTPKLDSNSADDVKPEQIDQHGTIVTLLGRKDAQNTVVAPEGAPYPTHWLSRYLNRRYFTLPDGIEIRVREFSKRDPENWPTAQPRKMAEGGQLRAVHGQKYHLDRTAEHSGRVELPGATAHWSILRDDPKIREQLDLWQSTGHTAALFQNELYELKDGQAGRGMLLRFGVLWGHRRIVIYVEPDVANQKVVSNAARNTLRVNKNSLPWDEWGEHFQDNMPDEITKVMEEIAAGAQRDHKESIKDRLKSLLKLYKLSRYKRTPSGDVFTEGRAAGGEPRQRQQANTGANRASGSKGTGNIGTVYGSLLVSSGDPAKKIVPRLEPPEVFWVSSKDGTRDPGDIEDRSAQYVKQTNTIKANADFRVFTDMVAHWVKEYKGQAGVEKLVTETVREWFEQQLVEAVLGAQQLHGSREWSDDDLQNGLSPEALTLAVMPRYHVYNSVKRTLGTKLGPLGR